ERWNAGLDEQVLRHLAGQWVDPAEHTRVVLVEGRHGSSLVDSVGAARVQRTVAWDFAGSSKMTTRGRSRRGSLRATGPWSRHHAPGPGGPGRRIAGLAASAARFREGTLARAPSL